jgi:hypothetical protein
MHKSWMPTCLARQQSSKVNYFPLHLLIEILRRYANVHRDGFFANMTMRHILHFYLRNSSFFCFCRSGPMFVIECVHMWISIVSALRLGCSLFLLSFEMNIRRQKERNKKRKQTDEQSIWQTREINRAIDELTFDIPYWIDNSTCLSCYCSSLMYHWLDRIVLISGKSLSEAKQSILLTFSCRLWSRINSASKISSIVVIVLSRSLLSIVGSIGKCRNRQREQIYIDAVLIKVRRVKIIWSTWLLDQTWTHTSTNVCLCVYAHRHGLDWIDVSERYTHVQTMNNKAKNSNVLSGSIFIFTFDEREEKDWRQRSECLLKML